MNSINIKNNLKNKFHISLKGQIKIGCTRGVVASQFQKINVLLTALGVEMAVAADTLHSFT